MWTMGRREIFVAVKVKVDPRLKGRPGLCIDLHVYMANLSIYLVLYF